MLSTLIKKQFAGVISAMFGGNRKRLILMLLLTFLLLFGFGSIVLLFVMMDNALYPVLTRIGAEWVYFALNGIIAIFVGLIGGIFSAKAELYDAKDNELLFAMPIKPSTLLAARLMTIIFTSFGLTCLAVLPCYIIAIIKGSTSAAYMLLPAVILVTLLTTLLSCICGGAVAALTSRVKHRSLWTVLLSVTFIVVYYTFYILIQQNASKLLASPELLVNGMGFAKYLGLALEGSPLYTCIFALIVIVGCVAWFMVLKKNYIKLALAEKSAPVIRKKVQLVRSSRSKALFRRELSRLAATPVYLLNCGLGLLMLPVLAVLIIWQRDTLIMLIQDLGIAAAPLFVAVIGFIISMIAFTAPSISLEGKSLSLLKTLPLTANEIFASKLKLHLILELPAAIICTMVGAIALGFDLINVILVLLAVIALSLFSALFGLVLNLKLPRLEWENETVAVKQSFSVMFTLFGGFAAAAMPVLLLLCGIHSTIYICLGAYTAIDLILALWLVKRGGKVFDKLS